MRIVRMEVRNPVAAAALGAAVIALGGAVVVIGLTILAGVVVAGAALGVGSMLFRRVTGGATQAHPSRLPQEIEANAEVLPRARESGTDSSEAPADGGRLPQG